MRVLNKIATKLVAAAVVCTAFVGMASMNVSADGIAPQKQACTRKYVSGAEQNLSVSDVAHSSSSSMSIATNVQEKNDVIGHGVMKVNYYLDGERDANGGYAAKRFNVAGNTGYMNEKLAFRYYNPNLGQSISLKFRVNYTNSTSRTVTVQLPGTMWGWDSITLGSYLIKGSGYDVSSVDMYVMGKSGKKQTGSFYLADISFTNDSNFGKYAVAVYRSDMSMGTISGGNCYVKAGSMAILKATPNAGYKFVGWSKGKAAKNGGTIVSTNSQYILNHIASDHIYYANFERQ